MTPANKQLLIAMLESQLKIEDSKIWQLQEGSMERSTGQLIKMCRGAIKEIKRQLKELKGE